MSVFCQAFMQFEASYNELCCMLVGHTMNCVVIYARWYLPFGGTFFSLKRFFSGIFRHKWLLRLCYCSLLYIIEFLKKLSHTDVVYFI